MVEISGDYSNFEPEMKNCPICQEDFKTEAEIQYHFQTSHKDVIETLHVEDKNELAQQSQRTFECPKCMIEYEDKFSFQNHMDFVHHGAKKIKTDAGARFPIKKDENANKNPPKTISQLEQCYICSKTFTEKDKFDWHMRYIHEEKQQNMKPSQSMSAGKNYTVR